MPPGQWLNQGLQDLGQFRIMRFQTQTPSSDTPDPILGQRHRVKLCNGFGDRNSGQAACLADLGHAAVAQGGDYVMLIKGNQPTIKATLESLFEKQAFSPSSHGADAGAQAGA